MPPTLLAAPPELLELVVLAAAAAAPRGRPTELRAALLVCRTLHAALCRAACPRLHANICALQFDLAAPLRRLPAVARTADDDAHDPAVRAAHVAPELARRFDALAVFARADLDDPALPDALVLAYLMLLEDDGTNAAQLRDAGLPALLRRHVRERLARNIDAHGWPRDDRTNRLALASLWLLSTEEFLAEETEDEREEMITSLAPFALAAFRYPISNMPDHMFHPDSPASTSAAPPASTHGPYPPPSPENATLAYFGRPLELALPPAAPYAILSFAARLELRPIAVPAFLPATRADVTNHTWPSPTQEDVRAFGGARTERPADAVAGAELAIEAGKGDSPRHRHELEWARAVGGWGAPQSGPSALGRVYRLGSLSGPWHGCCGVPCRIQYAAALASPAMPKPFLKAMRSPLYATFREHYRLRGAGAPLPGAAPEEGLTKAWFPRGFSCVRRDHTIEVSDGNDWRGMYTTLEEGDVPPEPEAVEDVIITGETEESAALAWGAYRWIGRVRPADGLVVLLRESLDPERPGRGIFKGYLLSETNFVGRWMDGGPGIAPAQWEGVWSLSRAQPCEL